MGKVRAENFFFFAVVLSLLLTYCFYQVNKKELKKLLGA